MRAEKEEEISFTPRHPRPGDIFDFYQYGNEENGANADWEKKRAEQLAFEDVDGIELGEVTPALVTGAD